MARLVHNMCSMAAIPAKNTQIICIFEKFVVILQHLFGGKGGSVIRVLPLHRTITNNTNLIRRNLASFHGITKLAFVSAHVVYYFCCICDSGIARASAINTTKVVFFSRVNIKYKI